MKKGEKMGSEKLIFWFEEIGREHNDIVGKKCANLGIMSQIGLPVPPGFAISIDLYRRFVQETGALEEISRHVAGLGDLKGQGITVYENLSRNIQSIIEEREMPLGVQELIRSYYAELCKKVKIDDVAVSVRSAGTESRPGMFETYLNVKGTREVLDKVKKVWASAYTARAIAFRVNKELPVIGDELGVAIPKMVNACSAGIGFTVNPITGDESTVIIESNWGLGEGVVSGVENVDRFIVKKETLQILERIVGRKIKQVSNKRNGVMWEDVSPDKQCLSSLNDEEIKEIARLAMTVEERLGSPQDIEWAVDLDFSFPQNIFLLQTRPAKVAAKSPRSTADHLAEMMAKGFKTVR
jgi:pyruvate,water dikinase